MPEPRVDLAHWQDPQPRADLEAIRREVFMDEQGVDAALEWDGLDAGAVHFLAYAPSGEAIACARLLADGQVGRMAVRKPWRGRGIGRLVLAAVLDYARGQHYPPLFLHAQSHAVGFYRRYGFVVAGGEFLDAGIPHRTMRLE